MDFIKKHLFWILCIAVSLLGIGIFISGMVVSADNQESLEQSISKTLKKVDRFRSQVIPEDEILQLQSQASGHKANQEQVEKWVAQTTRRAVLFRAVFPQLTNIGDNEIRFREFARRYCTFVESLLVRLDAGSCPSLMEETQTIDKFFEEHVQDSGAMEVDEREQENRIRNELYRKRAGECVVYADTGVFCAYDHWRSKPSLDPPMYEDAWYTQLAAWIQEDVVDAIATINGSSQSVLTSPVKRLLEVSFAGGAPEGNPTETYSHSRNDRGNCVSRRDGSSVERLPVYVTSSEQKQSRNFMSSRTSEAGSSSSFAGTMVDPFTGNVSNDVIDVVHFEVGLIIDSTRIQDFIRVLESQKQSKSVRMHDKEVLDLARVQKILAALQNSSDGMILLDGRQIPTNQIEVKDIHRNQITVLQMDIEPVDLSEEQNSGYYYGSGSFKVLRLTCEYFFFESGYKDLMPTPVREILNPSESGSTTSSGSGRGMPTGMGRGMGMPMDRGMTQ